MNDDQPEAASNFEDAQDQEETIPHNVTLETGVLSDAALDDYAIVEHTPGEVALPEIRPEADDLVLRVEIKGATTPLFFVLAQAHEAVIGRGDPGTQISPEIDLTPYGAYRMGISRRHALIRLQGQQLEIMDMGSLNGTFLNGKRLEPHQPAPLHDGDEVRVGKIATQVYIQKGSGT